MTLELSFTIFGLLSNTDKSFNLERKSENCIHQAERERGESGATVEERERVASCQNIVVCCYSATAAAAAVAVASAVTARVVVAFLFRVWERAVFAAAVLKENTMKEGQETGCTGPEIITCYGLREIG